MLAVGALLGFLVASGGPRIFPIARTSSGADAGAKPVPASTVAARTEPAVCSEGATKLALLALASPRAETSRASVAHVATARFLETFKEYPPRERAARFTIDQATEKMKQSLVKSASTARPQTRGNHRCRRVACR